VPLEGEALLLRADPFVHRCASSPCEPEHVSPRAAREGGGDSYIDLQKAQKVTLHLKHEWSEPMRRYESDHTDAPNQPGSRSSTGNRPLFRTCEAGSRGDFGRLGRWSAGS
jgi:hypothetical protein